MRIPPSAELLEFLGRAVNPNITVDEATALLDKARKYRGDARTFRELADALGEVAEQASEAVGDRVRFTLSQIVGDDGFLIPELDDYYQAWKSRRLRQYQDDLAAWEAAPPATRAPDRPALPSLAQEDYVRTLPGGRPGVLFNLLLGEGLGGLRRVDSFRPPQPSLRWVSLGGRAWPPPGPAADYLSDIVRWVQDPADLEAMARHVLTIKKGAPVDPSEVARKAEWIKRFLARYANGGDMTVPAGNIDLSALAPEDIGKILGRQRVTPEDFMDRMLTALDMMEDEVEVLAMPLDTLFEIPGIEGFFQQVVRRAGYEHGYRFEVFVAAWEIAARADEGLPLDPRRLWMQIPIGGKDGPDIIRLLTDAATGHQLAQILQAKSFKSLSGLFSESGAIREQIVSDLRRLRTQFGDYVIQVDPTGNPIPIAREIEFQIDYNRLRLSQTPPLSPDEVAAQVQTMVDDINQWLGTSEMRQSLGLAEGDEAFSLVVKTVDTWP